MQMHINPAFSDEELILKKNHAYFYQIQGQLHITKRKVCYFVIWTPLGIYVEQVKLMNCIFCTQLIKYIFNFR
jgi:hypothetical protein